MLNLDSLITINNLKYLLGKPMIKSSISDDVILLCKYHNSLDTIKFKYLEQEYYLYFFVKNGINYVQLINPEFDCANSVDVHYCVNMNYESTLMLSLSDTDPSIVNINKDYFVKYNSDKFPKISAGKYLVNLAHRIFMFFGINRVRLFDNSELFFYQEKDIKSSLPLWLYYPIKHGKSWFANFGYAPATGTPIDYQYTLGKIREINLADIKRDLISLADTPTLLVNKIIIAIGESTETLSELVKNHHVSETIDILWGIYYCDLNVDYSFEWRRLLNNFYMLNCIQVNNNVKRHCMLT